ncbi:hypothetical protein FA95DRAFT_1605513 [Auriscalpium vulgare]|uniref:Uncharacterized protein n=1 Tax=Auriscalpium vulgare TaxID=40419 RepID=A0ACB8RV29_9AGAM|nr:hypothetical protein FA95DRAFT_1605513 [Auriscalpium vulgare]
MGVLAYDYLITFDAEVNFVWRQRKRTWSFWLYIFNRFFPFAWILYASFALNSGTVLIKMYVSRSRQTLVVSAHPDNLARVISILRARSLRLNSPFSIPVILQMRVYALYELSKRLRYLLLIGCTAELVAMLALIPISVIRIVHIPWISTPTGCYYSSDIDITMFWIPALVFEPVLCALVAWKAWGAAAARWMRLQRSGVREAGAMDLDEVLPLVTLMARDSLGYFIGVYSVLVALTIASVARFDSFIVVMLPWTYALPSVLGSRIVLHVRELMLAEKATSLPSTQGVEMLVFAAARQEEDGRDGYYRSNSRTEEEQRSVNA